MQRERGGEEEEEQLFGDGHNPKMLQRERERERDGKLCGEIESKSIVAFMF